MFKRNISLVVLTASFGLLMTSCGGEEKEVEATPDIEKVYIDGDIEKGAEVFKTNCIACHQADGKGKAGFAPNIMVDCIEKTKPSIVLTGGTVQGRSLAPKVSARLKTETAPIRSS